MAAKDVSSILATWVGVIAASAGGYAGYLQYEKSVDKRLDERSLEAMRYVVRFQSEHFMPLRTKMYDYVFCRTAEACAKTRPSESETFAFVEFFDTVKYCTDKNLCGSEIIGDIFGPYATWHWPCLQSVIKAVRSEEAQFKLARPFGHGLETLAIKDVGTKHCGNLRSLR